METAKQLAAKVTNYVSLNDAAEAIYKSNVAGDNKVLVKMIEDETTPEQLADLIVAMASRIHGSLEKYYRETTIELRAKNEALTKLVSAYHEFIKADQKK